MTSDTTSHLDLTLMVAFHRDLGHLARAASRRPADLDQPARHTAVQAGWELFKTQLHIHHTAEDHDLWPRRIGIRGAAQFLPWVLDEASPQRIRAVLGGLPAPLRVVYRRLWQPRYARHDHWEPSTPA